MGRGRGIKEGLIIGEGEGYDWPLRGTKWTGGGRRGLVDGKESIVTYVIVSSERKGRVQEKKKRDDFLRAENLEGGVLSSIYIIIQTRIGRSGK